MRIAVIQKAATDLDYVAHLREFEARQIDLACFPELATSGCLYRRQPVPSLESVLADLKPFPFAVMLGLPLQEKRGLFNACLYCHRGQYQVYRKINLFGPFREPSIYQPGTRLGLVETDCGRLGIAICYDLRFEDIFARLAEAGATHVFVPAAFPMERIDDFVMLIKRRAVDHSLYVIGINAVGPDGRHLFGGNSLAVAPTGEILAEAGRDRPTVLTLEV
jgi:predicted amidohydrolase